MHTEEQEGFVSSLNVAAAPRHAELEARQVLARQFEVPTMKQLQRHAEKFGTEAVVQTAVELGYGFESCLTLQDFCDRTDAAAYRKEHPYAKPQRLTSSEKRVKLLMDLKDDDEEVTS